MFHTLDNTVAFISLDCSQQAAVWNSFFDAVDAGRAGHHPFYADLAPLYAAGAYLCEPAAPFEPATASTTEALVVELDEPPPF